MPTIKAQKVPKKQVDFTIDDLAARICYYFPQYKLHEVLDMRIQTIKILLKTISREKSADYFNMTKIARAHLSKKGEGLDKLLKYFQSKIEGE